MKRIILCLILGVFLVGFLSLGFVVAQQGNGNQSGNETNNSTDDNQSLSCDSDNLNLCLDETNCTNADGYWYNDVCNEEEQEEDNGEGSQGLGQVIRNRVKAGVYTSPTGEQIRVRELAQNRFLLQSGNVSADCECELEEETENNKTKLKVKLSNGRNAEIKIMPDVASKRALERLRLRVCSVDNNCNIKLKEVGSGNKTQLAYELQAERHSKLLWIFGKKMQVRAQIDAETGEIIRVKKPWWAFLASEPEEEETEE